MTKLNDEIAEMLVPPGIDFPAHTSPAMLVPLSMFANIFRVSKALQRSLTEIFLKYYNNSARGGITLL